MESTIVNEQIRLRIMSWDARVENDEDLKKQATKSRVVLPVVSDNLGASTNIIFTGKITLSDEPRSLIRKTARRLETNRASILADWEGGLTLAMQDVVGGQNLDSQIKEILLTRLVKASREGSSVMRDAFTDLEEKLNDRTEKRALWYSPSEINATLENEVTVSIREGMKNLVILKGKTNETLNQLAANKLVWVGAMLRDSNGKIEAWLYRDDVPDGEIVSIVPSVQPANSSRVVIVGRVKRKQASLSGAAETALAGRPLYWIRPVKTNSN